MSQDPEFCTVTMARIYEKQGQLPHAAQIYRLMLQQQPGRKDLQAALSAIENHRLAPPPAAGSGQPVFPVDGALLAVSTAGAAAPMAASLVQTSRDQVRLTFPPVGALI